MQNLNRLIQHAKQTSYVTDQDILNLIREYLQILILKAIYQSKYGKGLSFMGGTCLRICYDLKRYSEDLDFVLDAPVPGYSFQDLNEVIATFLKNTDFEVDLSVSSDKVVQKSFIRVNRVLHLFGASALPDQKLHVKLEVDTNPVKIDKKERETYFVSRFNETFPLLKHTDRTLFAGKIGAILNRAYTKGRDFYDLMWYLNHKTDLNIDYLNCILKQAGLKTQFKDVAEVMWAVEEKIESVNIQLLLKDLTPFLQDESEMEWIKNYPLAFRQAVKHYLA